MVFFLFALLWLGAAITVGYTIYDCRDILSRPVSFFLGLAIFCALIEFILLTGVGVAMIAGYH